MRMQDDELLGAGQAPSSAAGDSAEPKKAPKSAWPFLEAPVQLACSMSPHSLLSVRCPGLSTFPNAVQLHEGVHVYAEMAALKMGRGTTQLRERLDACLLEPRDEPPGMAKSSAGLQVRCLVLTAACSCLTSIAGALFSRPSSNETATRQPYSVFQAAAHATSCRSTACQQLLYPTSAMSQPLAAGTSRSLMRLCRQ